MARKPKNTVIKEEEKVTKNEILVEDTNIEEVVKDEMFDDIDVGESISEIDEEIVEEVKVEEPIKEERKEEDHIKEETVKVDEKKTNKKILNRWFGYIWNGMVID